MRKLLEDQLLRFAVDILLVWGQNSSSEGASDQHNSLTVFFLPSVEVLLSWPLEHSPSENIVLSGCGCGSILVLQVKFPESCFFSFLKRMMIGELLWTVMSPRLCCF